MAGSPRTARQRTDAPATAPRATKSVAPRRTSPTNRVAAFGRVVTAPLRVIAAMFRGDRAYMLAVLGALVLAGLLLIGPFERYLETRDRVDRLEMTAEVLDREVGGLAQRVDDLHDPTYIELLAREQQGFVREGEIPYRIVPPPDEAFGTRADTAPTDAARPWHVRLWDTVQRWLGADGHGGADDDAEVMSDRP